MKKYLFLILLSCFLFALTVSAADVPTIELNLDYPTFGGIDLNCEDSQVQCGQDLNQLVAWFYYFIVGIAGLAAFTMLVWGGFQWLTSAGNPARITDARDRIFKALLGLLLILASWLILQVINPELTMLKIPPL